MDSDALPSCLTYIENCYESFDLISFYKDFKFGQKDIAESIFKKCIGRFKRVENDHLRAWANTITANEFEIQRSHVFACFLHICTYLLRYHRF
jgi:hypothetical protein